MKKKQITSIDKKLDSLLSESVRKSSLKEGEHERGSVVWLQIGGPKGYYSWFFKKIDGTHFYMANNEKALSTGAAMVHHVGQHRGETYYKDLVDWLHGKIQAPKLNGKKYKGNG